MTWRFASSAARRQTRSRPIPRSPVPTDEVPADIPIPPNPPTVPRSSVAAVGRSRPSPAAVQSAGLLVTDRQPTAAFRPDPPPSPLPLHHGSAGTDRPAVVPCGPPTTHGSATTTFRHIRILSLLARSTARRPAERCEDGANLPVACSRRTSNTLLNSMYCS